MATTVGNWPLNKQYAQNEVAHRVIEVLQTEGVAAETAATWSDWQENVVPTLGATWDRLDRESVRRAGLGARLGILDWGKLFFGQEVSPPVCLCKTDALPPLTGTYAHQAHEQVKHTSDGIHPHPPGCWAYWNSECVVALAVCAANPCAEVPAPCTVLLDSLRRHLESHES